MQSTCVGWAVGVGWTHATCVGCAVGVGWTYANCVTCAVCAKQKGGIVGGGGGGGWTQNRCVPWRHAAGTCVGHVVSVGTGQA